MRNWFRKKTLRQEENNFTNLPDVSSEQKSIKIQQIIKDCKNLMLLLSNSIGAKFDIEGTDNLIITVNGIKAFVECKEDLFIINEIFNEISYGFLNEGGLVLIDIGLNIGIASLYFSQFSHVNKIYAYEPVEETYKKCLKNLNINTNTQKINTFNYGLGSNDRIDTFIYSENFKGSVGAIDLSDYKKKHSSILKSVKVEIKEASNIIKAIIEDNPGQKIMIKMDCEGGEYEIVPNLKASGILDKISFIVLEWHEQNFLEHLDHFNNFNCFYHKNSPSTGMLYAVHKST